MRSPINFQPVGKQLRIIRKEKALTQKELADRTGMSAAHLGRLERGVRDPRARDLIALADVLDVSTDALLEGCTEYKK